MLNNFYKRKNYYEEKLSIFTKIKDNERLILKNNTLIVKNIDDCNNLLPILSIILKIFFNENEDPEEIKKYVEKIFTEYLEFIDNIIQYMHKKQCFQDQYLILLSEIEKNNNKINEGLIKLINTYHKENLSIMYKSILFSFFDFSKLLSKIKNKVNIENTNLIKKINKVKDDRTYSF